MRFCSGQKVNVSIALLSYFIYYECIYRRQINLPDDVLTADIDWANVRLNISLRFQYHRNLTVCIM